MFLNQNQIKVIALYFLYMILKSKQRIESRNILNASFFFSYSHFTNTDILYGKVHCFWSEKHKRVFFLIIANL